VAAGGDGSTDFSALHWATVAEGFAGSVDSGLYGQLAQNETITGQWTVDNSLGMIFKKAGDADTGYVKYDGASMYLGNNRAGGNIYIDAQSTVKVLNGANFTLDGGLAVVQTSDGLNQMYYRANVGNVEIRAQGNATRLDLKIGTTAYAAVSATGLDVTGALAATGAVTGSNLNVSNWDTAYGWGDHSGLYSVLAHTHTFASLTSKPTTLSGYGITDGAPLASPTFTGTLNAAAVTISGVLTANGTIVGDGATTISGIEDITVDATGDIKKTSHGNYLFHKSTAYDNDQNGEITFSTSAPSGGTTGDIWFEYTA
jgi:hypothetical protein